MKSMTRAITIGILGIHLTTLAAWAALSGQAEFQVNAYTVDDQENPGTCVFDDGSFVVVWQSNDQDGDYSGIFGRRYSAAGLPLSSEFQINTYTSDAQFDPSVCCADDSFVVAWTSATSDQDGHYAGVFGQRFAAGGAFVGGEFQVNTYTSDDQSDPDVCCQADGRFVVAWRSDYQDGYRGGIFGQAFASGGAPSGGEFQVNTYTAAYERAPASCCDGSTGFVVVWESQEQDGDSGGLFAQAFSGPGAADGAQFQVNTATVGGQFAPDICCSEAGFVVAWSGQDGDLLGVFAQVFSGPASPVGSEVQVNTYTAGDQDDPAVCCDEDRFEIVWEDNSSPTDTDPLFGRTFSAAGQPQNEPFVVTQYTDSDADDPAIACDPDGDLLVVWESESDGALERDGDEEGIFAKIFLELSAVEIPTLGGWGLGLLAAALAAGGAVFLHKRRDL